MAVSRGLMLAVPAVTMLLSTAASAAGFYQGRASLSPGLYDSSVNGPSIDVNGDGPIIALDLGGAMGFSLGDKGTSLLFDLDLEAMTVDSESSGQVGTITLNNVSADFERTDIKLTSGLAMRMSDTVSLSPFIGYRFAWQGDGYFNDDFYTESGFFIGAGASFKVGDKSRLSTSLAYNLTKLDQGSGGDVDANGYSAKVAWRFAGPFGVSLKYQGFETDRDASGTELDESYLLASVTWYFMQGRM